MDIEKGYWQRRLSRRRVLRGAAVGGAGLAAASVIGCGDDDEEEGASPAPTSPAVAGAASPAASAAETARRGGTINRAGGETGSGDTRGRGLDPHKNPSISAKSFRLFYQGLVGYHPVTLKVEPELAQKWEQPSPTEYIFTLQPGVKWHKKAPVNGRELTAQDIVLSLERARTNDPRFLSRALFAAVDKIEAPDAKTVRITTKAPDATALGNLSEDQAVAMAPEVFEKEDKFATADTAVGTGAFILTAVEDKVRGEYTRNPEYWKPGLPYLDGLQTRYFQDNQLAYAAFLSGDLDIAPVPGNEAKAFVAKQGAGYEPLWYGTSSGIQPIANTNRQPFGDVRVRKALRLLMDHAEYITAWADLVVGKGANGSILGEGFRAWDFTHDEYFQFLEWKASKDDAVKEALSLLSAAGFTKDKPLKFEVTNIVNPLTKPAGDLLEGQWRRLGQGVVQAALKVVDASVGTQVRANREFDYVVGGVGGGSVDPDSMLSVAYRTKGGVNYGDFSDAKLDEMIDKQRTIFNETERKKLMKEIITYTNDVATSVSGSYRSQLTAVKTKVRGVLPEDFLTGRQYEMVWISA